MLYEDNRWNNFCHILLAFSETCDFFFFFFFFDFSKSKCGGWCNPTNKKQISLDEIKWTNTCFWGLWHWLVSIFCFLTRTQNQTQTQGFFPSHPGDSGSSPDSPPEWLDQEKFKRGQLFFQKHVIAIINILYQSLTIGLGLRVLLEPLVYTKQSHTAQKSRKRYLQTFFHLLAWHTGDVWQPGSRAYKSVQDVRKMHNRVSQSMNSKKKNENDHGCPISSADSSKKGGLYFSQYDMATVQFAFVAGVVLYPRQFGIDCSVSDQEDYIHFWRGIGYLLGIQDNFNMCSGTYTETLQICKDIEEHNLPELRNPPKESHSMAKAFSDGINLFFKVPVSSVAAIHALWYYDLKYKITAPCLGFSDWLRLYFLRLIVFLCWWFPFVEVFLSKQILKSFHNNLPEFSDYTKS